MLPIEILKLSLPRPWLGILTGLQSDINQLAHMEKWLKMTDARHHDGLCWTELLDCLIQYKPLIKDSSEDLQFVPVLFHLPDLWQCHLLTFIHQHNAVITRRSLRRFIDALVRHLDQWPGSDSVKDGICSPPIDEESPEIKTNDDVCLLDSDDIKQTDNNQQHPKSSSNHSWTDFGLEKLKTNLSSSEENDTNSENNKNRCYKFSGEHLQWKNRILSVKKDELADSHNICNPWSFGLENKIQDIPGSSLSKGPLDNRELQIINEEISILDEDSSEITPTKKKIKLDNEVNEDLSLLSQALPGLNEDLLTDLQNLKETWHSGCTETRQDGLNVITQCSQDMIQDICKVLELPNLPESSLATVAAEISSFKEMLPLSHAAVLAEHCLLQKMTMLGGTASRHLLEACVCLTEAYPSEVIYSVLTPVLLHPKIGSHHCDLIIKLLKDTLQNGHRQQLIRSYVEKQPKLCAPVIQILQYIIEVKTDIDEKTLGYLVRSITSSSCEFVDSLKFGKLLLALIKQYNKQLSNVQVMELEQAAVSHGTFLKKSILAALNKINKT